MCGIAGIIARDADRPADGRVATRMADAMLHRGPDGDGLWVDGPAALSHRRLKIIDLSDKARQPMSTPDGRHVIVFNGEIYNYRELRKDLEARGIVFRSSSDTEVLLHAYVLRGAAVVRDLNGIFAFAVWDRKERVLFGARDQMGIKPFYYVAGAESFLFASEIKALLAAGHPAILDAERIPEQLAFGSVAGEATLFKDVRRLPAGASLEFRLDDRGRDGPRITRYFDLGRDRLDRIGETSTSSHLAVRSALEEAVRRQMVSDVPVGSMCSGGVDSSGITALGAELNPGINTFCVKIAAAGLDETPFSRDVSRACHTTHHELETTATDIPALLPTTIWLADEPLRHPNSIAIFQISRLARETITVLLSGEGADELFGGYTVHRRMPLVYNAQRFVPNRLLSIARNASARFGWRGGERTAEAALASDRVQLLMAMRSQGSAEVLSGLTPGLALELSTRQSLARQSWEQASGDPIQAALFFDQRVYLPTLLDRQDKMCMGTSVESRVPYLDIDVVKLANALPVSQKIRGGVDKIALRGAILPRLPASIANRPKLGFGLPFTNWLRTDPALRAMFGKLADGELARSGVIDRPALAATVQRALAGDERVGEIAWNALNLEIWWGLFLSKSEKPDLSQIPAWRTGGSGANQRQGAASS